MRTIPSALVVLLLTSSAAAQDIQSIPPGDDKIEVLRQGQPAPFTGQLFEPNTALRWANWLRQYQLTLKLDREYAQKTCQAQVDFLSVSVAEERARYKSVTEDYQKREALLRTENLQLRQDVASPPWYSTVWFGIGLGVVATSVAFGMGVYAAK